MNYCVSLYELLRTLKFNLQVGPLILREVTFFIIQVEMQWPILFVTAHCLRRWSSAVPLFTDLYLMIRTISLTIYHFKLIPMYLINAKRDARQSSVML